VAVRDSLVPVDAANPLISLVLTGVPASDGPPIPDRLPAEAGASALARSIETMIESQAAIEIQAGT
jgi:hypothetical protein